MQYIEVKTLKLHPLVLRLYAYLNEKKKYINFFIYTSVYKSINMRYKYLEKELCTLLIKLLFM